MFTNLSLKSVVAGLGVTALASSLLLIAPPAAHAAGPVLTPPVPPSTGLLFGASVDIGSGQTAAVQTASMEATVGHAMALNRSYSRWDATQPSSTVLDDAAHGRTPLLSIVPQRTDGSKATWASIAAGTEDGRIRAQADGLRDLGIPLILVFHHEADISTGYGGAADFINAYRHFVAVFEGEGAANVAFGVVFVPWTYTYATTWYPGDDVVDWIGADAYNCAACAPGLSGWRTLAVAAAPFYNWGSTRGKPLMLAEWGSAEDPSQPTRRAQWLRDSAVTLANWPAIKAVSYFDHIGTCDWRLNTSSSATAAFTEISRQPWANGASTARLLATVPIGAADLSEAFDVSSSTGAHSATGTGVATWNLDFGDGTPDANGTGQPSNITHTYQAGHWTATLTVADAGGSSATATTPVIAAPAPVATEGNATSITTTSATVPSWVDTNSLSGSYYVEWGPTTAYGSRTAAMPLASLDYTQNLTTALSGLPTGTRCYWHIVATSAAGTTAGPARWFSTLAS